jgi:hypothetical protein
MRRREFIAALAGTLGGASAFGFRPISAQADTVRRIGICRGRPRVAACPAHAQVAAAGALGDAHRVRFSEGEVIYSPHDPLLPCGVHLVIKDRSPR